MKVKRNTPSNIIKHYGIKRRSGRYPWGSGGHGKQRTSDIYGMVDRLRGQGLSETEIATALGISTTELRTRKSIERARKRSEDAALALRLKDKGMSNVAIGKQMGINESSVRALLDPALKQRNEITKATADMIKSTIEKKGVVDVGAGVESGLGISRTKLNTAVQILEDQGYKVYYIQTEQLGTGKKTSIKVLAPPGMDYSEVSKNRANINTITDYSENRGRSYLGLEPVKSVSDDRVLIRYMEEGGGDKDGLIELRRGVDDLNMGNSRYAQVRIGVDGTKYMKGMAVYADNLPPGVDIIYNTNKSRKVPKDDVYKAMVIDETTGKIDQDNPFGATIKKGGQKGALNIVNEEDDWRGWSRNLSSQILSKQSPALAKKQLELAKSLKVEEFEEIMSLTNPVVKKRLLQSFSDDLDASAVHLKATALPRQASHVILPIPSMKQTEVYAPMFRDGENVVLFRHPHGGIFEIPELVVNNKNSEAKSVIGRAADAVGIHPKVAKKLSGADFDGDTVIVIPNPKGQIKHSPSLKALKDFDPIESYPRYEGMKKITPAGKQLEMGNVSNLITDMTIKGASDSEIARAVKHSMVVIDAEKHDLNYKLSYRDNGIGQLKEKYQGGVRAGAATLISRASSKIRIPFRREGQLVVDSKTGKQKRIYIDPKTGKKLYEETKETYLSKSGQIKKRLSVSTKMEEAKSAFDLSSGTRMESIYAKYADDLKNLANRARLEYLKVPNLRYSPSANKTFKSEVESLKAKLRIAFRNKPLERKAQLIANEIYRAKLKARPDLDPSDKQRLRGQVLEEARVRIGAKKQDIVITDREWLAIQAGAISHNTLSQIVLNTDLDKLKQKAIPRTAYKMTPTKLSRAKSMFAIGYTPAEIASAIGVSATTVVEALK